jgi:hypothetical protein
LGFGFRPRGVSAFSDCPIMPASKTRRLKEEHGIWDFGIGIWIWIPSSLSLPHDSILVLSINFITPVGVSAVLSRDSDVTFSVPAESPQKILSFIKILTKRETQRHEGLNKKFGITDKVKLIRRSPGRAPETPPGEEKIWDLGFRNWDLDSVLAESTS